MSEIDEVLREFPELGFIEIADSMTRRVIEPQKNVYINSRWTTTLNYLMSYSKKHEDFGGSFFVCIYDGWRECSEYCVPTLRTYKEWNEWDIEKYKGTGNAKEPRFFHDRDTISIYPDLPHKVLTYNRHIEDTSSLLIPDSEFLITSFYDFKYKVDIHDKQWNDKKQDGVFWNGSPNIALNGFSSLWNTYNGIHPRHMGVNLGTQLNFPHLNASYSHCEIKDQLEQKYLLSIDGMVNPWSGFYWKLYSNSLVFKMTSIWEQWYYPLLKPYEDYIEINNFSDISYWMKWCSQNDEKCKQIALNGKEKISKITIDYALNDYIIH